LAIKILSGIDTSTFGEMHIK